MTLGNKESHGPSYSSLLRLNAVSHLRPKEGGSGTGCSSALGPRTGLLEKDTNKNPADKQVTSEWVTEQMPRPTSPQTRRLPKKWAGERSLFSHQIVKIIRRKMATTANSIEAPMCQPRCSTPTSHHLTCLHQTEQVLLLALQSRILRHREAEPVICGNTARRGGRGYDSRWPGYRALTCTCPGAAGFQLCLRIPSQSGNVLRTHSKELLCMRATPLNIYHVV